MKKKYSCVELTISQSLPSDNTILIFQLLLQEIKITYHKNEVSTCAAERQEVSSNVLHENLATRPAAQAAARRVRSVVFWGVTTVTFTTLLPLQVMALPGTLHDDFTVTVKESSELRSQYPLTNAKVVLRAQLPRGHSEGLLWYCVDKFYILH